MYQKLGNNFAVDLCIYYMYFYEYFLLDINVRNRKKEMNLLPKFTKLDINCHL